MLNKKLMIITIFLVSLLAVSAVSAADNATSDVVGIDGTTGDVVSVEENQLSNQTDNYEVLSAEDGTFTALQNKMTCASEGSTIALENDYSTVNMINPTSTSPNSAVNKLETNISAVYNAGARELVATLVNVDEGKIIKGATVVINIDGIEHNSQTDSKGQVTVSTANLNIGDYAAAISYKGNSKYNPSSTLTEFSVNKVDSNISAVYDKKSEELIVTVTNAVGGNGLIGATVQVNLAGTDYALRTDSKGQVKISTADLALGSYPVSISYNGNSKYYPSNYVGIINTKFGTNVSAFYDRSSKELIVTASNLVNGNGIVGATILITLDGNDHVLKTDSKGQVKISTTDLAVGMYTAYIAYNGNSKYNPSNANVIVNNRIDTNISAFYDSASRQLVATLVNVDEGKFIKGATVLVNIDGKDHVLRTDSKGQVNVSSVNLNIGDYAAVISYNGNSKYNPSSTILEFSVNKVDSSISAFYDKKSEEFIVTVTNAVGGNGLIGATVLVNFGDTNYVLKTDSKGQVKVSTSDLALGTYPVSISYNGNSKYYSSTYADVVNTKFDTNVSASYNVKSRELVVTASNVVSGKGLAGATVQVNIGGNDYVLITNSQGQIKISTLNLNIGDYTAVISYNGNSKYNPSSTLFEFSVNKVDSSISAVHNAESEVLFINVTNAIGGNGLVGATVQVNIDGTTHVLRTDSKGQINMSTSYLTPGNYTITISYNGNSKYYSSGATVNVVVNKVETQLYANNLDIDYGEEASLVITLKDSKGNAIGNVELTVNFNGETYTLTTDYNGNVQLPISGLTPNYYTANINFAGNDFYSNASTTATVDVNKMRTMLISSSVTASYGVDSYLIATLTASPSGEVGSYTPLKGATVVITIDNTQYSLTTDSNGQVKFNTKTLLPGTYSAEMIYYGDSIYRSSWGQDINTYCDPTITINKANPTITTSGVTTTYGTEGFVTATLNDPNGNVMANRLVTFTFEDGTGRTVRTDKTGKAQLSTLGIATGTHTISVTYVPESGSDDYYRYNSVSSSVTMKINKANAALSAKSGTTWIYRNGQQLNTFYIANKKEKEIQVYLEDQNGNPLVGKSIKFSSTYASYSSSGKTDSQGIETFKLKYNHMFPYINPEIKYYTETFTLKDDCYTATITVKVGVTTN